MRELVKGFMFALIWAGPMWLSKTTEHYGFLWLFIVSFIVMCLMFAHYETLERNEPTQTPDDDEPNS